MTARIIYPNKNGLSVIIPYSCGLSVEEIARKDVPAGLPFLIASTKQIPVDRTFREAWEADFSEPHGHGLGPEAWFAEQAAKQVKTEGEKQ